MQLAGAVAVALAVCGLLVPTLAVQDLSSGQFASRRLQQAAPGTCVLLGPNSIIAQSFQSCAFISGMGGSFWLLWTVQPASNTLLMGLNVTTGGSNKWASVGFPASPNQMSGANAFVVSSLPGSNTGATLQDYYLTGTKYSSLTTPSQLNSSTFRAATVFSAGQWWLVGSFQVQVPAATIQSTSYNLIIAKGPTRTSGALAIHTYNGNANVNWLAGTLSGYSGAAATNRGTKIAHGLLMVLSWGLLIPSGIVFAHSFKEADPLWFKAHRAIQTVGFVLGLVGFGIGFAITGSWTTPYTVHRNLGLAVTVLGACQVTALVLRPLKTSPIRRYWNWNHWWIGRAAAVCAIVNIYYGIINCAYMSTWAWALYTGLLSVYVIVAVVKDYTDIKKGRRTLGMLCTGEVIVKEGEGPEGAAVAKGFPPVNDDAVEDGIAKEGDPKP